MGQIVSIVLVVQRYLCQLEIVKFRNNQVDIALSLNQADLLLPLSSEITMQCIINPPFAQEASFTVDQVGKNVSYTWDAAVCLFAIIRLTICIARLVHHLSRWTSEKAHRISWISGTKANVLFALKMNLNLNPSSVLASVFLTSFFLLSILYHVAEGGLRDQGAYNRFWNFENAAWVAVQ